MRLLTGAYLTIALASTLTFACSSTNAVDGGLIGNPDATMTGTDAAPADTGTTGGNDATTPDLGTADTGTNPGDTGNTGMDAQTPPDTGVMLTPELAPG